MKVFQIVSGFCHYDATRKHQNAADAAKHYSPDTVWVDAPDYVFEGWCYDETKEGDERFIQPQPPEGWLYDPDSGTFYQEGDIPPSKQPTPEERIALQIANANAVAAIAFVTLAESGQLDDVTAGEHAELFSPWEPGVKYEVGNLRQYSGKLYRCVQAHTSQVDWTPDETTSMWVKTADPAEEWPEWSQPIGAHDAYNVGDKVSHNGKHWISEVSSNVWEPGVYGWMEA